MPPEEITDDSPLIRNARSRTPKPVEAWQISQIVRNLYYKAEITTQKHGSGHPVTLHSIRKFFRT